MTAEDQQHIRTIVVSDLLAERDQLRRWLLAVSLGRATKETHAAIRDYLREVGW